MIIPCRSVYPAVLCLSRPVQMAARGVRGSSANAGSTSTACHSDVFTIANLLRLKPVQDVMRERTTEEKSDPEGTSLKKALGIPDLIGYGVGCTVGELLRNGKQHRKQHAL